MLQPKLLDKLLSILNKNNIDYMITGSIVSSIQGEPRSTHDVDIVINIQEYSIPVLIKEFPNPQFYIDEFSIKDAIQNQSMFNLIDTNEGDKIDFWILTNEAFDISRFERKYEENIFGFNMKVSMPEDTILAKLKWAKLSGGSEKQFIDALRVYEIQYEKLDINYLNNWVKRLELNELWERIQSEAKPI